ncbi:MAG: shikimate dehydrogenase [Pseudomonadota bacterium]
MSNAGDWSDARRACVIGWPIKHSRSPLVHGHWLSAYGIDGAYTKEAVPPVDIGSFFNRIRSGEFVGCNVTIPHKEAVFLHVDEIDDVARACGAINTVWRDGERLCASSTDGAGFLAHLDASAPSWRQPSGRILVLGAGGAARGIVDALLRAGHGDILIANRTTSRSDALIAALKAAHPRTASRLTAVAWAERNVAVKTAGLIVNTTALGMQGQPTLSVDLSVAQSDATVADIVYTPLETSLLADARAHGLVAVDGLGMLLHQAVPGFERWFGVRPHVTDSLRAKIVADL